MAHGDGMTIVEAARYLGVSLRSMQRYIRAYQAGDRSKGFVATQVLTQRGNGYEWRITFAPDTTALDATGATGAGPTAVATPTGDSLAVAPTTRDELVGAALRAVEEAAREREALARRLGQAEAERDALRAQLDKQAREEDTARPGALQRAWRAIRRKGGE